MYEYGMGDLEKNFKKRKRKENIQKAVLYSVKTAGVLSLAVLAPNSLQYLRSFGITPAKRQKEIINELPNESLIYLGDTARIPYGTRSKELITKFSLEMVGFLLKHHIKFLVVACNTISTTCLEEKNLLSGNKRPKFEFYVTDAPERAKDIAEKFFGEKLPGELNLTNQFLG